MSYKHNHGNRGMMNPWQQGSSILPHPSQQMDAMSLVNNLVGALVGVQQQGMMPQGHGHMRDSGRDYNRRRNRSPIHSRLGGRGNGGARPRSKDYNRRYNRHESPRRRRSPPASRAEHEIYVGNYPANYTVNDLKKLFARYDIEVGYIRLKGKGVKVFAFAETESDENVQKAKALMEGIEIEGRKLRVRGSKDSDKKRQLERNDRERDGNAKRRKKDFREPTVQDTKKHLIAAFVSFLDREMKNVSEDSGDEFKDLLEAAKTALVTAYNLPEDNSLNVHKTIEDLFFRAVRADIKLPVADEEEEGEKDADVSVIEHDGEENLQDNDDDMEVNDNEMNDEDGNQEKDDEREGAQSPGPEVVELDDDDENEGEAKEVMPDIETEEAEVAQSEEPVEDENEAKGVMPDIETEEAEDAQSEEPVEDENEAEGDAATEDADADENEPAAAKPARGRRGGRRGRRGAQ